jgi:hypothetical protein
VVKQQNPDRKIPDPQIPDHYIVFIVHYCNVEVLTLGGLYIYSHSTKSPFRISDISNSVVERALIQSLTSVLQINDIAKSE